MASAAIPFTLQCKFVIICTFYINKFNLFGIKLRFAKVIGVYQWLVDSINNWEDCSKSSESQERLLQSLWQGGPPEVQESPFETIFDEMNCAYILDDTTIRQAIKMYYSTPNLAILIYGDPKYWDTTKVTDMSWLFYSLDFNADISEWVTSKVTDTSVSILTYSFLT